MEKFDKSIFQFGAQVDMSDQEYKEATTPTPSIQSYQRAKLTILDVEYRGPVKSDPTWVNFKFTLGFGNWTAKLEDKEKDGETKQVKVWYDEKDKKKFPLNHFVNVPTKTVQFAGKNGDTPYVFRNTQEFLAGLGFDLLPSTMSQVLPTVFADPSKLIGLELELVAGYSKKHVAQTADGTYYVADRNGKALKLLLEGEEIPNSYPDRATAEAEAIACNHDIDMSKTFLEVLKIFPAEEPAKLGKAKTTFDD